MKKIENIGQLILTLNSDEWFGGEYAKKLSATEFILSNTCFYGCENKVKEAIDEWTKGTYYKYMKEEYGVEVVSAGLTKMVDKGRAGSIFKIKITVQFGSMLNTAMESI